MNVLVVKNADICIYFLWWWPHYVSSYLFYCRSVILYYRQSKSIQVIIATT